MKSTDDRSLQSVVIASDAATGNVTTIPATQATSGNGRASLKLGFPPETFISRSAGGNPPYGADTNGLFKLLSQAIQSLQAGYVGQFDSTFATAIGGYPSGAIVCGSTAGTFWVSTADNNLTTPGADGASWQSLFNGYATESWASDTFVGKAEGDQDYSPLQAGVNKTSGEIWLSYTNSSGTVEYAFAQIAGDYALQTALTAEVTRATTVESNLQSSKVNRAGDTMTDALYNSGGYNVNYSQAGTDTNGVWYNGFTSRPSLTSSAFSTFVHRTRTGKYDYLSLQLTNSDGGWQQLEFRPDGRLYTTGGNTFALTSELPASGTTIHGSYVTVGNIRTLYFMLENIQSGTTYEFDLPFSGTPHSIVVAPIAGASSGSDPATGAWSASGFVFWNAGNLNGSYSFIATGPA